MDDLVPASRKTLRFVATHGDDFLDDVRVACDASGRLCVQIPRRLLGQGPIALRIIVERDGAVIQELHVTIDIPAADFDARHWRV